MPLVNQPALSWTELISANITDTAKLKCKILHNYFRGGFAVVFEFYFYPAIRQAIYVFYYSENICFIV